MKLDKCDINIIDQYWCWYNLLLPLVTTLNMVNTFTKFFSMFGLHLVVSVFTECGKACGDLQCSPSHQCSPGDRVSVTVTE